MATATNSRRRGTQSQPRVSPSSSASAGAGFCGNRPRTALAIKDAVVILYAKRTQTHTLQTVKALRQAVRIPRRRVFFWPARRKTASVAFAPSDLRHVFFYFYFLFLLSVLFVFPPVSRPLRVMDDTFSRPLFSIRLSYHMSVFIVL